MIGALLGMASSMYHITKEENYMYSILIPTSYCALFMHQIIYIFCFCGVITIEKVQKVSLQLSTIMSIAVPHIILQYCIKSSKRV